MKVVIAPNSSCVGGYNGSNAYFTYLYGFAVNGEETRVLESIDLSLSSDTILIGRQITASVAGTLKDGSEADLSELTLAEISYSSTDETVAEI